jgi:hypothetical protein
MTDTDHAPSARVRWARLRFQIVGPLLASPADAGELKGRIEELAARAWRHPTNGESIRFSFKTIERWWYIARAATDPFAALARKVHGHAGTHPSLGARSPKRSQVSIATTRDGASSSITTTCSHSPARIPASGPCPATRRSAAS